MVASVEPPVGKVDFKKGGETQQHEPRSSSEPWNISISAPHAFYFTPPSCLLAPPPFHPLPLLSSPSFSSSSPPLSHFKKTRGCVRARAATHHSSSWCSEGKHTILTAGFHYTHRASRRVKPTSIGRKNSEG